MEQSGATISKSTHAVPRINKTKWTSNIVHPLVGRVFFEYVSGWTEEREWKENGKRMDGHPVEFTQHTLLECNKYFGKLQTGIDDFATRKIFHCQG